MFQSGELACDALALSCAAPSENKAYGQTIIRLLEGFARPSPWPGLLGILEDTSQMKRRMTMIAMFTKNPRWSVRALLLLVVLGLVTLTDAQSKKPEAVVPKQAAMPVVIEALKHEDVAPLQAPQVAIELHWCEVDEQTGRELDRFLRIGTTNAAGAVVSSDQQAALSPASSTNTWTEILTNPRFRVVWRTLDRFDQVVLARKVTTMSGRPTEIRLRMTGPGWHPKDGPLDANGQPAAPLPDLSPVIHVVPYVAEDGYTISLHVTATINEFIGYDLNGAPMVWATGGPFATQPPIEAQSTTPLPVYRLHHVSTNAVVWDAQTLMLGGLNPGGAVVAKEKPSSLGDLPFQGRRFRSESSIGLRKNLLIFITPTIIDSAGNRIHPTEQKPF